MSSPEETIAEVFDAIRVAEETGGKVVVCLCGIHIVPAEATVCPGCGEELKRREL